MEKSEENTFLFKEVELENMLDDRAINPKQIRVGDAVYWKKIHLKDTVESIENDNGVLIATLVHAEEKAPLLELEKREHPNNEP